MQAAGATLTAETTGVGETVNEADARLTSAVRTDWLANLGLEVPTTPEELLEVARQFTFDDPDGNGKDDKLALFAGRYGFAWYPGVCLVQVCAVLVRASLLRTSRATSRTSRDTRGLSPDSCWSAVESGSRSCATDDDCISSSARVGSR